MVAQDEPESREVYIDDKDPVDEKFGFDYSEDTLTLMKGVGKPSWQESDSVGCQNTVLMRINAETESCAHPFSAPADLSLLRYSLVCLAD